MYVKNYLEPSMSVSMHDVSFLRENRMIKIDNLGINDAEMEAITA